MTGYDIIGDIHGCANELLELLHELGYRRHQWSGAYQHPDRRAVFVGDLVDRGPAQLHVLEIVKAMVDAGNAHIVMGNHEFNAIAYSTENPTGDGRFLRPHSAKNEAQHSEFLKQVTGSDRARYLRWFRTLPLWLDLGEVRIVHACWHEESIQFLKRELGSNRFTELEQFVRASQKDDPLFDAVEVILKGPELSLVEHGQPSFRDKDGHLRQHARLRWWNETATSLRDLAEMSSTFTTEDGQKYPLLPDIAIPSGERSYVYKEPVPVFYGHYWRQGSPEYLLDWTKHTACVDFSAVKGGELVAYRWSGEAELRAENFFSNSDSAH